MPTLPMFPLGSVLLPTMVLPLHIFEPRYRALVHEALLGAREFGVCLIERGSEVGGGDVRSSAGTVAQIIDAEQFDDGRWAIVAVGTRRIRVERWLEDDPYPRAEVEDWLDDQVNGLEESRATVEGRLRQVLALASEVGIRAAPATTPIDDDPGIAGYQMAALAPVGEFDRQRLLCAASLDQRLSLLDELLADAEELLRHRIEGR